MKRKITDITENTMVKRLFTSLQMLLLACLVIAPAVVQDALSQENLVTFSVQNRRVEAGQYRAELWARVSTSASWTVQPFQVHINFNSTGLSVANLDLLDPDVQINTATANFGNEPLLKQRRSISSRVAVIVDAQGLSGVIKPAGDFFRIGTMRWSITNGTLEENFIFNDSVTTVRNAANNADLQFNTGSSNGYGFVAPQSFVINVSAVQATIASVVAPQISNIPFEIPLSVRNQDGGLEPVTQATVVGVHFDHPNLSLAGGSTQGTIPAGQSTTTLNLTVAATGDDIITTTFTVQSDALPSFVVRGSQDITIQAKVSSASDIVLDPTFTTSATIAYANMNNQGAITPAAHELARFLVRDGGADAPDGDLTPTTVTGLTISLTNHANVNTVGLYQGMTLIAQQQAGAEVTFSDLEITADDNSTTTMSIRATFNSSVTDKETVWVAIQSVTTALASSKMALPNAGGAANTSGNEIDVVADRLIVTQQPSDIGINLVMSPAVTVSARDVLGNTDLDWNNSSATISVTSGTATIASGSTTTANLGIAVFNNLSFSTTGANNTLWVESGSLAVTAATASFDVIGLPAAPGIVSPADNAAGLPLAVDIQWETISGFNGATSYTVQASASSDFNTFLVNETILTTSQSLAGLEHGTQYHWRVRSHNIAGSSAWTTAAFRTVVDVPVLLAPANSSTNVPVTTTAQWQAVTGATWYAYQISTQNTFTDLTASGTTANLTAEFSSLANGVEYFWRVRATDASVAGAWSSPFSFTTIVAAPGLVTLVSPANGAGAVATTTTAQWNTTTGATSYEFQLATTNTFAEVLQNQNNANTSFSLTSLNNFTEYWWRVRASNVGGTSAWSTASFTTVVGTPTLTAPANNAVAVATDATYSWTAVAGAESYTLQVDEAGTFTNPNIATTTTATSFAGSGLSNSTMYNWRVRANNAQGNGAFSTVFQFTTIEPPPTAPTITSPINGSQGVALDASLNWNSGNNSPNFDVQVSTTASFAQNIVNTSVATSTYQFTAELDNNTTYWWRIRGVNSSMVTSEWVTAAFTTVVGTPVLVAPAINAENIAVNTTASWNAVAGATSYGVQLSTNSTFTGTLALDATTTGTTAAFSGLANSTQYWWRVRASNAGGDGLFSQSRSFTTEAPPADRLLFVTVNPSTLTSGESVEVTVETRNSAGNIMSVAANTVVELNFGSAALIASSGSTSATINAGQSSVTFNFTLVNTTPIDVASTITASADGLTSTTQNITVQSVPTILALTTSQTSTGNGTATFDFTVTARDGAGIAKNVTSSTIVEIAFGGTGFVVSGTSSATIAAGSQSTTVSITLSTESLTALTIPATASATGFTASTASVTVPGFVPPAAALAVSIAPNSVNSGENFTLTVQTRDANGNPANVAAATAISIDLGNMSLALATGSLSATIAEGANSTSLTLSVNNMTASSINTNVSVSGGTLTASSASLTVAPAPVDRIAIASITPNPANSGSEVVITLEGRNNLGVAIAPTAGTGVTGTLAAAGLVVTGDIAATFDGASASTTITLTLANTTAENITTTLTLTAGALGTTSADITVNAAAASVLAITSAPATANDQEEVTFELQVQNTFGTPINANSDITVSVAVTGATIASGQTTRTIAAGASSTTFTLSFANMTASPLNTTVAFSATSFTETSSSIAVSPAPATRFAITLLTPNPVMSGSEVLLLVEAQNTYGIVMPVNATTAVQAALANTNLSFAGGLISNTIAEGASGTALVFAINNPTATEQVSNIEVSGGLTASSASITVVPAPPTGLQLAAVQTATGNGTRSFTFTATTVDGNGNPRAVVANTGVDLDFAPVTGFTFDGDINAIIPAGQSSVTYNVAFTNQGFADINLTVTAISTGFNATNASVVIPAIVPPADRLMASAPANTGSGETVDVVVTARNFLGNAVAVTTETVVTISGVDAPLQVGGGTLTGTIAQGQSETTISFAIVNPTATAQVANLNIAGDGLTGTNASVIVAPAAADRLVVQSLTPNPAASGQQVTFTVEARNQFDVAVAPANGTSINLTFTSANTTLAAGATTFEFDGNSAIATFNVTFENSTPNADNVTLTVGNGGLAATTAVLTVGTLPADRFAIASLTPNPAANQEMIALTVEARNSLGVASAVSVETPFTVTFANASLNLSGGSVSGVIPAGQTSAMLMFDIANTSVQAVTTDITVEGGLTATAAQITVNPAPGIALVVEGGLPQTIPAGTELAPITVGVRNVFGLAVPSNEEVTLTLEGPTTITTTASFGGNTQATFAGITLPQIGTWTATLSAPALAITTGTVSGIGVPTSLEFVSGLDQSIKIEGQTLDPIVVRINDQFGNALVATTTVTLTFTTTASTTSFDVAVSGAAQASFNAVSLSTAGFWSVSASFSGLNPTDPQNMTIFRRQTIALNENWNWISLNVIPQNTNVESIVAPLINANELVTLNDYFNETVWAANTNPQLTGESVWNFGRGYRINVRGPINLVVDGMPIDLNTEIALLQSFNQLPYYPNVELPTGQVFGPGGIAGFNTARDLQGRFYWPDFGLFNLTTLSPGQSYLINLSAATSFAYAGVLPRTASEEDMTFIPESNRQVNTKATDNSSLMGITIDAADDTEVGAYNEAGQLIASGVVRNGKTAFVLNGDDTFTKEVDGLRRGERITLKLWRGFTGGEENLKVVSAINAVTNKEMEMRYEPQTLVLVQAEAPKPLGAETLLAYPNPAVESATVRFVASKSGRLTLEVHDLVGRKVATLADTDVMPSVYEYPVNARELPSGVYRVVARFGAEIITTTLVVRK